MDAFAAGRYGVRPYPAWLVSRRGADVALSDDFRRNVVFIGVMPGVAYGDIQEGIIDDGGGFLPKATGFVASVKVNGHYATYVVTAEHVISGLQERNYSAPIIRFNKLNGDLLQIVTRFGDWTFHPNPTADVRTDVAVIPIDLAEVDYAHVSTEDFVNDEFIKNHNVRVGTEVAIVGLFKNHYGIEKNLPIVRIGNIAAMPDEPVRTQYCGYIDAYLIEARSISGISGSPVWLHMGPWWFNKKEERVHWIGDCYNLLGLVHGHFDVKKLNDDVAADEDRADENRGINTGIGLVIPAKRIVETLMQDDLARERAASIRKANKDGATPDLGPESGGPNLKLVPPTTDKNPQHKEDFTRLLDAAARGKSPADET